MTGLEVVEERKKGARPSTVKGIEMARLNGIHTTYKLMVPEHQDILAIAASRDPNLDEAADEADDPGERRVRPRSSEQLGHVSEPSRHQAFFDGEDYSEDDDDLIT